MDSRIVDSLLVGILLISAVHGQFGGFPGMQGMMPGLQGMSGLQGLSGLGGMSGMNALGGLQGLGMSGMTGMQGGMDLNTMYALGPAEISPTDLMALNHLVRFVLGPTAQASPEMLMIAGMHGGSPETITELLHYLPMLQDMAVRMGIKPPGVQGTPTVDDIHSYIHQRFVQYMGTRRMSRASIFPFPGGAPNFQQLAFSPFMNSPQTPPTPATTPAPPPPHSTNGNVVIRYVPVPNALYRTLNRLPVNASLGLDSLRQAGLLPAAQPALQTPAQVTAQSATQMAAQRTAQMAAQRAAQMAAQRSAQMTAQRAALMAAQRSVQNPMVPAAVSPPKITVTPRPPTPQRNSGIVRSGVASRAGLVPQNGSPVSQDLLQRLSRILPLPAQVAAVQTTTAKPPTAPPANIGQASTSQSGFNPTFFQMMNTGMGGGMFGGGMQGMGGANPAMLGMMDGLF